MAPDLRAQAREFIGQREEVEREIKDIRRSLGFERVGEKGALVDDEGFPRSDVDVHSVRQWRNRLACLYNDHKVLSEKIEKALHEYFEGNKTQVSLPTSQKKPLFLPDSLNTP